jgi:hypothetical protein
MNHLQTSLKKLLSPILVMAFLVVMSVLLVAEPMLLVYLLSIAFVGVLAYLFFSTSGRFRRRARILNGRADKGYIYDCQSRPTAYIDHPKIRFSYNKEEKSYWVEHAPWFITSDEDARQSKKAMDELKQGLANLSDDFSLTEDSLTDLSHDYFILFPKSTGTKKILAALRDLLVKVDKQLPGEPLYFKTSIYDKACFGEIIYDSVNRGIVVTPTGQAYGLTAQDFEEMGRLLPSEYNEMSLLMKHDFNNISKEMVISRQRFETLWKGAKILGNNKEGSDPS